MSESITFRTTADDQIMLEITLDGAKYVCPLSLTAAQGIFETLSDGCYAHLPYAYTDESGVQHLVPGCHEETDHCCPAISIDRDYGTERYVHDMWLIAEATDELGHLLKDLGVDLGYYDVK